MIDGFNFFLIIVYTLNNFSIDKQLIKKNYL